MSNPKILFICTHNSARSQLAEGLLRNIYGEKYEVFSAGTNPTKVNPFSHQGVSRTWLDISYQYSERLD